MHNNKLRTKHTSLSARSHEFAYKWYTVQASTGHCAMAQAPPFDEHRRPLAPYW